jgi:serine/threonine protein phosphatase PrpC
MRVAARSDCGSARSVNEDYVLVDAELGLVVVADGQGGVVTGALAARLAAEGVCELIRGAPGDPEHRIGNALRAVDRIVFDAEQSDGRSLTAIAAISSRLDHSGNEIAAMARSGRGTLRGMHAALTLAMVVDDRIAVAHVGNCRAYRVAAGVAIALTNDHVLPGSPRIPLRWVGSGELEPEVQIVHLLDGERLLLCSDGLHQAVDDATIAELAQDASLDCAADLLMARARETSTDNIAIALLDPRATLHVSCHNGPTSSRSSRNASASKTSTRLRSFTARL